MTMSVQLPDTVVELAQASAKRRMFSLDAYLQDLIRKDADKEGLDSVMAIGDPLIALMERIRSTQGRVQPLRTPAGHPQHLLTPLHPDDAHEDWREWQREWNAAEANMKAAERADTQRDLESHE